VWKGGPSRNVGDLLGTLEGKDAQLVLSYIVWPNECPDPRLVDEWLRRLAQRNIHTDERGGACLLLPLKR
jgi:hypothetical protein